MRNLRWLLLCSALLWGSVSFGHPDGMKPYWYPSSWVYGFVEGCWETIEETRIPLTEEVWPVQIKAVCGCVIDALRHSVTFAEIEADYDAPGVQLIVNATLPVCVEEQRGFQ